MAYPGYLGKEAVKWMSVCVTKTAQYLLDLDKFTVVALIRIDIKMLLVDVKK